MIPFHIYSLALRHGDHHINHLNFFSRETYPVFMERGNNYSGHEKDHMVLHSSKFYAFEKKKILEVSLPTLIFFSLSLVGKSITCLQI